MSLIRPVIRMCARAALMGKTWAENRVYDSMNTPLADQLSEDAAPYISIYTDEDNVPEITGKDVYLEPRNLSLTLEIGCAKAVAVAGSSPHVEIPQTDEGLEFTVDLVQTQALAALMDPKNAWAELLRKLTFRFIRMPSHRGGSAQAGTRWAARQLVLVCDTVADSPPGVVPGNDHPVMQFIEMAKASPDMVGAGILLESVINNTENPNWRQVQAWLNLSKEGIRAIGLAPVVEEDEEEPELTAVNLSDYVPWPPTISLSSPVTNPPVFVVELVSGNNNERDTKAGDFVQVLVNTRAEIFKSAKLTATDISNGNVIVTGGILPDGEHKAFAMVQRSSLGLVSVASAWSEAASFIIG